MADQPKSKLTEDPEVLKALLATTEKAYREAHESAAKTQEHTDRMLTWAIGLMGGGLYGAYSLLRCGPAQAWIWALLPWLLGILCALAGRMLIAQLLSVGGRGSYARVSRVQLLMLETDGALISRNLQELISDAEFFPEEKRTKKLQPWALVTYYTTHLLFAAGVLSVAFAVIRQSLSGACP